MSSQSSQQQPTKSWTSSAREAFSSLAVPPALFAATRGNPNWNRTEAHILHLGATASLFQSSLMHAQGTLHGCQGLPGLHLGYPEAAGHFLSFSLQQQQQMQHALALLAGSNFAPYGNPFSACMNYCGRKSPWRFSSPLPPYATMDPSFSDDILLRAPIYWIRDCPLHQLLPNKFGLTHLPRGPQLAFLLRFPVPARWPTTDSWSASSSSSSTPHHKVKNQRYLHVV